MADIMNKHRRTLEKLAQLISRQQECGVQITEKHESWTAELEQQRAKTDSDFMVLVVGAFNSGKSSLINALIGEEFLPTGMLPETGVLTEMHYGETKRIRLFPKPGMTASDAPFELKSLSSEEIARYCSIDNTALIANKPDTSNILYEKVVIEWPLEILKDGIVLVDTVGMDDPWGNDYITKAYFPKASAIIYLMSSTAPYDMQDKELLTDINSLGISDVIFAFTRFDSVLHNYRRNPEGLEKYQTVLRSHCENHTRLGSNAVHFIDSMEALDGKLDGDESMVIHSGLDGLEKFLNNYLVNDKGAIQVRSIAGGMRSKAKLMLDSAMMQRKAASMGRDEKKKRVKAARDEIRVIEQNKDTILRNMKSTIGEIVQEVAPMVEDHFKNLADKADMSNMNFSVQLPRGIAKLNPFDAKKKANALRDECAAKFQEDLGRVNKRWIQQTLTPCIQQRLQEKSGKLVGDMEALNEQLDHILVTLTDERSKNATRNNAILGTAYGLLTGDWINASIAGVHGVGALGKAIVSDIVVGAALYGLLSAGVAISLPVAGLAFLVGNLVSILIGNDDKKEAKLRKQAIADCCKAYNNNTDGIRANADKLTANIKSMLMDSYLAFEADIEKDIVEKRNMIDTMADGIEADLACNEAIIDRMDAAIVAVNAITTELDEICAEYEV